MLSAVLVQLFGREVIDRLALAGFETAEAIAAAGPERLADESRIPLALARRIIAVASEERGQPVLPDEPVPAGPAPAEAASHERHVRRPFRRPLHPSLTTPDPAEAGASARGAKSAPARAPKDDEGPPIDRDPFVDDVGLVSWMGFAARHGGSQAASFSVSDAILEPGPAALPEEAASGAPPSAASPGESAGTGATRPAAAGPGAANTTTPRSAARRPAAEPDRRAPEPAEGSFWSFGAPRNDRAAQAPPRPAGPAPAPDCTPRRRSRDGH